MENTENFIFRPAYNGGGVGYADVNYTAYGGGLISGLKVLGYDVSRAMAIFNARGGPSWYNSGTAPIEWWDTTVVLP